MNKNCRVDIEFNWKNFRDWAVLDLMFFRFIQNEYSVYIIIISIQILKYRFHIDLDINKKKKV